MPAKNPIKNFFTNKKGKLAVAQWPNTPLWTAVILWLIGLVPVSELQLFSQWAVIPVILYWAYLEIFFGDSSFRRLLGTVVALNYILTVLQLLKLI